MWNLMIFLSIMLIVGEYHYLRLNSFKFSFDKEPSIKAQNIMTAGFVLSEFDGYDNAE